MKDLNKNLNIQPILIGGDLNCYSVARAYHEEYGVKSIAIGRYLLGATKDSKIIDFRIDKDINNPETFVKKLIDFAGADELKSKTLILHGCTDEYAELIIDNREELSKKYITPYINPRLKDRLIEKESFYKICEEFGLDYPKTYIFNKGDRLDKYDFNYPIIVKASDSISFFQNAFEGMNKAYMVNSKDEFEKVITDCYSHGYEKSMIIQDYIPGDDSHMRVLTCYSDRNGKVTMQCLGHVLLEEHTPKGIGNHAAIITEYAPELYEKYRKFLETINYVGYSNFDLKYDERDGKYKVFEINLRQGRSNHYVTSSGNNIAKNVVEDRVLKKNKSLHVQKDEFYWHVIPNNVVFNFVENKDYVDKAKKLIAEGKSASAFDYKFDLSGNLKRRFYLFLYGINQNRKYNKYCKKY